MAEWVDHFAAAAAESARLATSYLAAVARLQEKLARAAARTWCAALGRRRLEPHRGPSRPPGRDRRDRRRGRRPHRPAVNQAAGILEAAGVLIPLTSGKRNRAWESQGLLELLAELEAGGPA